MQGSAKVRAARKAGQLDRIQKKGELEGNAYAEYFANLPKQKVKAAVNEQIRVARSDLRDSIEDLQVAEETGEGLLAAQEKAHVAQLVVEKLQASKVVGGAMTLTSVGSAAT